MELHHKKHHQTYVTGLNNALETIASADPAKAASVAPLLNFHGGGHINHSLFWENLAPASREGGGEPDGSLKVCYLSKYAPSTLLLKLLP
jgi:Fe-Mn family superoxide dismutase